MEVHRSNNVTCRSLWLPIVRLSVCHRGPGAGSGRGAVGRGLGVPGLDVADKVEPTQSLSGEKIQRNAGPFLRVPNPFSLSNRE